MEINDAIKRLMFNSKVDKFHIEFWEESEEKDAEHLVKINVEKEYY